MKTLKTAEELKNAPPGYYVATDEAAAVLSVQIVNHIKPPKQRRARGSVPPQVTKAYAAYKEAYEKLYGVEHPGYTYETETGFIRLKFAEYGVSVKRLGELTRQLKYRKG